MRQFGSAARESQRLGKFSLTNLNDHYCRMLTQHIFGDEAAVSHNMLSNWLKPILARLQKITLFMARLRIDFRTIDLIALSNLRQLQKCHRDSLSRRRGLLIQDGYYSANIRISVGFANSCFGCKNIYVGSF